MNMHCCIFAITFCLSCALFWEVFSLGPGFSLKKSCIIGGKFASV